MAMRHSSQPPAASFAWDCPSCGAPNAGRLEKGCTACGAGSDGKAGTVAPPAGEPTFFDDWLRPNYAAPMDTATYDLMRKAWDAGAAWALGTLKAGLSPFLEGATPPAPHAAPIVPKGGWVLAMVDPDTHEPQLTDSRTHATILAALAFYRDNQLAYGLIPGQLTAIEATTLIESLTPREPETEA